MGIENMTSKFIGRDYATLREEIIEFLRQKLPQSWDYTNLSDPVVVFSESLAALGDSLHYTIDELRRECDMATAKRASSIYSYAMREGYKMFLPCSASSTISINTTQEMSGRLHLTINPFDEFKVKSTGDTLYAVDAIDSDLYAPLDQDYIDNLGNFVSRDQETGDLVVDKEKRTIYSRYATTVYNRTQHLKVVAGKKSTFSFTYGDINNDSTVTLPDPMIDRNLVRLIYKNNAYPNGREVEYVDDVISSGFNWNSFTLTPKFIGGAITLCIEFPTNYRDIFNSDTTTTFTFEYVQIQNVIIDNTDENNASVDLSNYISKVSDEDEDADTSGYIVDLGSGVKGYSEYENPNITKMQYKNFVQDYSALLTKDDYANYIKVAYSSYCSVYDHSDNYKENTLPAGTQLLPRVVYIATDDIYKTRETMWYDLRERSSRSDCIVMVPYGKDPYTIFVKAECNLLGTSAATVATQIKSELMEYYDVSVGEKVPEISVIDYLVHKASDKVIRMENLILQDTTFGTIDSTFSNVNQLSNKDMDDLFNALKTGDINYSIEIVRTDNTGETSTEKIYPLRGEIGGKYYNKYPTFDFKERRIAGDKYAFPNIYVVVSYNKQDPSKSDEQVIDEYTDLVEYQTSYGELDRVEWDISDDSLYAVIPTEHADLSTQSEDESTIYFIKVNYTYEETTTNDQNESVTVTHTLSGYINKLNVEFNSSDGTCRVYKALTPEDEQVGVPLYNTPDSSVQPIYYIPINDEVTLAEDVEKVLDPYYTKHHYVVPVLNNIVVLVKATSN
jgi:hypothetical protein